MARTVLFFESHSGFFDGAQQSLYLLLTHLDRQRFRPIFVGPEEGLLTARLQAAGIKTIILRHDGGLERYGGAVLQERIWRKIRLLVPYMAYAWRIRRIMREDGVDIVHCNSTRSVLTVGPAARMAGVPLIWHLRLNLDLGWWNPISFWLADRVIVVSESLRDQFPVPGVKPAKFTTVYNGVDLRAFEPGGASPALREELRIPPGWQAIGTTGSLHPRKDQLVLLRVFATLIRTRPRTKLVVVGEARGPEAESYAKRLRAYVAAQGLDRHVTFTGWRSDVPNILRALDLFVLPSLNEGLPRAILEAMALALPVVATRVGGNAELVVDGQTGLLVPAEDPDALLAAMTRILQDPDLAGSMGRRGRVRVEKHFSLQASVRGVEAVMGQVLGARQVRSGLGDPAATRELDRRGR
jgi:glycosyltransferase involved in cell wall biosynthesis